MDSLRRTFSVHVAGRRLLHIERVTEQELDEQGEGTVVVPFGFSLERAETEGEEYDEQDRNR